MILLVAQGNAMIYQFTAKAACTKQSTRQGTVAIIWMTEQLRAFSSRRSQSRQVVRLVSIKAQTLPHVFLSSLNFEWCCSVVNYFNLFFTDFMCLFFLQVILTIWRLLLLLRVAGYFLVTLRYVREQLEVWWPWKVTSELFIVKAPEWWKDSVRLTEAPFMHNCWLKTILPCNFCKYLHYHT